MILAMQIVGLFLGISYTAINVARIIFRQNIPAINFFIMSAAWTLFITATWLI